LKQHGGFFWNGFPSIADTYLLVCWSGLLSTSIGGPRPLLVVAISSQSWLLQIQKTGSRFRRCYWVRFRQTSPLCQNTRVAALWNSREPPINTCHFLVPHRQVGRGRANLPSAANIHAIIITSRYLNSRKVTFPQKVNIITKLFNKTIKTKRKRSPNATFLPRRGGTVLNVFLHICVLSNRVVNSM